MRRKASLVFVQEKQRGELKREILRGISSSSVVVCQEVNIFEEGGKGVDGHAIFPRVSFFLRRHSVSRDGRCSRVDGSHAVVNLKDASLWDGNVESVELCLDGTLAINGARQLETKTAGSSGASDKSITLRESNNRPSES